MLFLLMKSLKFVFPSFNGADKYSIIQVIKYMVVEGPLFTEHGVLVVLFLFIKRKVYLTMKQLMYENLCISASYLKGQDYLDLTCTVLLNEERTGTTTEGGTIRAAIISSNWTSLSFTDIAAGLDENILECARCLELNNLTTGTAAFITESECKGIEREYEAKAFEDLTSYLTEVLHCDLIITYMPFNKDTSARLGYKRVRAMNFSYLVRIQNDSHTPFSSPHREVENYNDEEDPSIIDWAGKVILNRLSNDYRPELIFGLSNGARCVFELFNDNGNIPLTKSHIYKSLDLSEDDLSYCMMELLEKGIMEEEIDETEIDMIQEDSPIKSIGLLEAVQNKEYDTVCKLLQDSNVDVNEVDNNGQNALFIALRHKELELIKLLLEAGIDPNYEDSEGLTAMKLCWISRNRDAENLLKKYGATLDFD